MEKTELTFEDAMKRLQEIVSYLENGEAPLDKSLAAFEEGVHLVKFCSAKLEKAEKTVKTAKSDLSKSYKTVTVESCELEGAGQCQRINVSDAKGSKTPKDSLQTVYIIPLGDGCIVAAAHYTIESAEGFGARFSDTVNTIAVIGK